MTSQDRNIFEYFATYQRKARRAGVHPEGIKQVIDIAQGFESYEDCRDYLLTQIEIL